MDAALAAAIPPIRDIAAGALMRADTDASTQPPSNRRSPSRGAAGENQMELIAERGRRVSVEELNTTKLLAHARQQAVQRNYDEMLIVDCDAHHYENENYGEILPFMENDVLRQLAIGGARLRRPAKLR
jgi:hypothetical protein